MSCIPLIPAYKKSCIQSAHILFALNAPCPSLSFCACLSCHWEVKHDCKRFINGGHNICAQLCDVRFLGEDFVYQCFAFTYESVVSVFYVGRHSSVHAIFLYRRLQLFCLVQVYPLERCPALCKTLFSVKENRESPVCHYAGFYSPVIWQIWRQEEITARTWERASCSVVA